MFLEFNLQDYGTLLMESNIWLITLVTRYSNFAEFPKDFLRLSQNA